MNIAIGTDGAGSNNALSMFREMYLDTVLSNVETNNAAAVDPFKILKAGTSGGALCMGLNESDVLAEGKKADVIMIDMNKPSMQPENNVVRNIIYSADNSVVKMTMIDGKILYEDGQYKTIDLDEVIRECNKFKKDLNVEEIKSSFKDNVKGIGESISNLKDSMSIDDVISIFTGNFK